MCSGGARAPSKPLILRPWKIRFIVSCIFMTFANLNKVFLPYFACKKENSILISILHLSVGSNCVRRL